MNSTTTALLLIITCLLAGCTPSLHLTVKNTNIDTTESDLHLHFEFERIKKSGSQPSDLQRIWIYQDDKLVVDLQQFEAFDTVQSTWDFPSIPKGFKITFPENLDSIPPFSKSDHLRFNFLAGGGYENWEYHPK